MSAKAAFHSFLIQNFQEFYTHLLRQKAFALRATDVNDPQILETGTEEQLENPIIHKIQHRFALLFERQALESTTQSGEFSISQYQEALYAMVSFADEVFLNMDWIGKKHWENNLLESRFFQTQIAGEMVFQKIESLIARNDPMRLDLAIIYLFILGLGFKGKYRDEDDQGKLDLYRQQLFTLINRRPPTLYESTRPHLIPDCYEHVLDSTISKGLPEIRGWLYAFCGILGIYLFASTVLWYMVARDMNYSIGHILRQAHQMGLT
jgi:type VI secretion system protein ImpK